MSLLYQVFLESILPYGLPVHRIECLCIVSRHDCTCWSILIQAEQTPPCESVFHLGEKAGYPNLAQKWRVNGCTQVTATSSRMQATFVALTNTKVVCNSFATKHRIPKYHFQFSEVLWNILLGCDRVCCIACWSCGTRTNGSQCSSWRLRRSLLSSQNSQLRMPFRFENDKSAHVYIKNKVNDIYSTKLIAINIDSINSTGFGSARTLRTWSLIHSMLHTAWETFRLICWHEI